ncbi:hypothetical protein BB381_04720 [Campylobacter pinnipediorum subsp. caledonicus]|nr:hypothetical protein BB381_04720 [Campylobacter pinnipediorum subsp. caledonicus]
MYLPNSIIYGSISEGIVVSLMETNKLEALEYIKDIPIIAYILVFLYIILFIIVYRLNNSIIFNQPNPKIVKILTIIIITAIIHKPIETIYETKNFSFENITYKFQYYPLRFIIEFTTNIATYHKRKNMLSIAKNNASKWQITNIDQKYKNYILIIGESMRRDYMSLYGYSLKTTPFLDNVNGLFFNNYVSPSWNTPLSLQRTLTQHDDKNLESLVHENTIISLANDSNMDTYWLSNQGKMGSYDILQYSIAIKSKNIYFTTKNGYSFKTHSDLELIPEFYKAIEEKTDKNKLIVLHLIGSHSVFCDRIDKNYNINNVTDFINEKMSCYLSSIRQTDKLIQMIYQRLQEIKETFSIMYFSDHGLSHKKKFFSDLNMRHDPEHKQNYEVPFLILSSDDTNRTYINSPKSGYDFMYGFAYWLGIEEKNLSKNKTFFTDKQIGDIKIYNGKDLADYKNLKNDPAILPKDKNE